jgi:formate hydrogenlyase subunit 3/multisubunit Na+/H+ antiporter MnhD subunit
MFTWPRTSSRAFLEKRTDEQVSNLRRTFDSRLHLLFTVVLGLLSLSATVRSIWYGAPSWWVWLLATAAIIGSMFARERAAARFFEFVGEGRGHRDAQESRRQRYLWAYAVVGVAAFLIGRAVMPDPVADPVDSVRVMIGMVCLIIAALAALGAGWSAVWVFKDAGRER